MSESVRTARETIDLFLRTVTEGSRDDLADLYAADVRIEMPFAPGGIPAVTEGREIIRARMKAAEGQWQFDSVENVTVHETGDPEVLVVEYQVRGRVSETGKVFTLSYVAIMRIVDGLIAWSRDYGNPLEVAELVSGE